MTQTTARIKKNGKHFEILVNLEEALNYRKDAPGSSLGAAVITDKIFHNLKSGEVASDDDLEINFETREVMEVASKIIKNGEVVKTTDYIRGEQDKKYKQVVDFLHKNAVSPQGMPYTPDRLMKALEEAHVNIKNKPIESQIQEIIDQLSRVLPLKIEKKRVKITVPALHTGKAYGVLKEFIVSEEWTGTGNLEAVVEMPTAMLLDFYDRINSATHGSVLSEELRK
jgi:ribosome maturation protein SDO1